MKKIIFPFFSLVFILGCSSVTVYHHTTPGWNGNIAFHHDWPTYGLPLTEYSVLMKELQEGKTEDAKRRLDIFLDVAIDDALSRRKVADAEQIKAIDNTLLWTARMRHKYPRCYTDDRPEFKERLIRVDKALNEIYKP
jgi:hypothetical protein